MTDPKLTELLLNAKDHLDVDVLVERIARHGAKEALKDLGLDDPEIRKSIRDLTTVSDDLKDVAQAWKALGWVRKAVLWVGGLAAGITGIYHAIGHWWSK